AEASRGWIYQDDLLRGLDATSTQRNIDIFRLRDHFANAGLQDAVSVIERRPVTRQVRVGTGRLESVRLCRPPTRGGLVWERCRSGLRPAGRLAPQSARRRTARR